MQKYQNKPEKGHFYGIQGTLVLTGETEPGSVAMPDGSLPQYPIAEVGGHRGKWSDRAGAEAHGPVQIGDTVEITFNGLGQGRVCAFFIEEGFIGVQVEYVDPKQRPEWHRKQHSDKFTDPLVFGAEIRVVDRAAQLLAKGEYAS
jgi:hypothetical protein